MRGQLKAIFIISKYSLLAMLRSPTSIVFSLLFPIIFITVFGSIDPGKPPIMKLAVAPGCDTSNVIYSAIEKINTINLVKGSAAEEQSDNLQRGRITAILNIKSIASPTKLPHYTISLRVSNSSGSDPGLLQMQLNEAIRRVNQIVYPGNPSVADIVVSKEGGRVHRSIDFILPGQLGFSLLMAGVYGSSFLLFSLRKNWVLKRMRATPVSRGAIISGEMLSRLFFHVISFLLMIALGYFIFNFTLVNGLLTVLEMLLFSFFGLFIFMGTGFMISGLVQSENSIAPIANTIVLPQILLCGLFFPVSNYPHWMEQFCNILPLTLFVAGLRKIAFEGSHLWQLLPTIGGLLLWTGVIGILSVRSFKWE